MAAKKRKPAALARFVILPTRGVRATTPTSSIHLASFLQSLGAAASLKTLSATASIALGPENSTSASGAFKVVDAIAEDGAKLVEMTHDAANDLLSLQPGIRIVPETFYAPARVRHQIATKSAAASVASAKKSITLTSKAGGSPVVGAMVVAFTDFANRVGAQGTTNNQGIVNLTLGAAKTERIYIYPKSAVWPMLVRKFKFSGSSASFTLLPINLSFTDELRRRYGVSNLIDGHGVTVGVVDTGVAPHPDLTVAGGLNCVVGELPADFGDNGEGHGTHVAGIIAAFGTAPAGVRGLAPAATIRSYRVFGKNARRASNFSIAKAIDQAWRDGCDLVNLSLGGPPSAGDDAVASAIHDAREHGCAVLAATGNEDRSPVDFPARDPLCIAVSAYGRKGTFPKDSVSQDAVAKPFGKDSDEFMAAFSNIGSDGTTVNLTCCGVGILSTVPGGYASMDGTSMATPAATGVAARLLAGKPAILGMPRDQARSDAIVALVLQAAKSLGFPASMEGKGLPQ